MDATCSVSLYCKEEDVDGVPRSPRRHRTIGLLVGAKNGLTTLAPQDVALKVIEAVGRKRSTRIFHKLGAARTTVVSFNSLEFVSGDSIRYLCRCYRLRIVESEQTLRSCKLIAGLN
jgi:hypothetical protein